ncbi:hypothetical protein B0I35DRAFT_427244 [Stachybotrys elegans]|uniref:Uncharacterized protein n=1 Tax=Stachybotrys elegans TaxID=80388 RepID=A0A8K0SV82_9HYPO|nr:hypothetical protein B0I35DRAFT_427244 [Stachybotrys elegans]
MRLVNQVDYLSSLTYAMHRDKYNLPIYTLCIPGACIYVVNSMFLISQVQKRKMISLQPVAATAAANVMNVGEVGNAIIGSDRMFEDGKSKLSRPPQ